MEAEKTYLEVGIVVRNLRLAVRLPRWRLLRLRRSKKVRDGEPSDGVGHTLETLFRRNYRRTKKSAPEDVVNAASNGCDWVRDFHQRYNPIYAQQGTGSTLRRKETLSAEEEGTLPAGLPTSTPVNLRIRPLHRGYFSESPAAAEPQQQQGEEDHLTWVPVEAALDVTGVKIYENVVFDGAQRQLPSTIGYSSTGRSKNVKSGDLSSSSRGNCSYRVAAGHTRGWGGPRGCSASESLNSERADSGASAAADDALSHRSRSHRRQLFSNVSADVSYPDETPHISGVPSESSQLTTGPLNTSYLDEEELMRLLSASLLDDSYEIVSVADQRVVARAHFRPRTLKCPRGEKGVHG